MGAWKWEFLLVNIPIKRHEHDVFMIDYDTSLYMNEEIVNVNEFDMKMTLKSSIENDSQLLESDYPLLWLFRHFCCSSTSLSPSDCYDMLMLVCFHVTVSFRRRSFSQ
jgi:hypothetical protein